MNVLTLLPLTLLLTLALLTDPTKAKEPETQKPWKIINYWSITCAPCRIEIPELNALSKELRASDTVVLGVNFDEDERDKTLKLATRMGIEFPTLTQAATEALQLTPPNVLPTTFILSPDNKLVATLSGAQTRDSIKFRLDEILEQQK